MRLQLIKRHVLVDRFGISDYMQIILLKINHTLAATVFHKGIANGPFIWHLPVPGLGARRYLMQRKLRQDTLKILKGLQGARPRQAATVGKQIPYPVIDFLALIGAFIIIQSSVSKLYALMV